MTGTSWDSDLDHSSPCTMVPPHLIPLLNWNFTLINRHLSVSSPSQSNCMLITDFLPLNPLLSLSLMPSSLKLSGSVSWSDHGHCLQLGVLVNFIGKLLPLAVGSWNPFPRTSRNTLGMYWVVAGWNKNHLPTSPSLMRETTHVMSLNLEHTLSTPFPSPTISEMLPGCLYCWNYTWWALIWVRHSDSKT